MIKKSAILTGALLLAFGLSSFGQSKKEWLNFGDEAFDKGDYASAAFYYQRVIDPSAGGREGNVVFPYEVVAWYGQGKIKSDTTASPDEEQLSPQQQRMVYVTHQIAESYRRNHDYDRAIEWFEKAVQHNSPAHPDARFRYGQALMNVERYDQAGVEIENYVESASEMSATRKLAEQVVFGTYFASDPSSARPEVQIRESDSVINTGTSNYAASYYGDYNTLLISSGRPNSTVEDKKKENPNFRSDLYTLNAGMEGWNEAVPLPFTINTNVHEGAGALSIDRTTFYFTRWTPENPNDCAIYASKYFNYQWLKPMRLNNKVNVAGSQSMHPALKEDGSGLYYSSNRPGGQGGFDIWFCPIDDYGNLGDPINLGPTVNTAGDEKTPFHHWYTKTLYFSSDGHSGLGGLDIFRSTQNEDDSIWSQPTNMARPINSSKDDAFFILDDTQNKGFFSSDRAKCDDCKTDQVNSGTTYCMKTYELEQPDLEFSIKGTVFNAETDEVIANALVTFKDIRGHFDPFFIMTDEKGNYNRELEEGWDLFLKAQKVKFFGDAASISTVGLTETKHFIQDFFLTPIPAGEIEIPGIEYDYDKATLRPASKKILDDLVSFLELNDNIIIEIRSHTDERGSDEYNMRLSEERAKSVVNYLIANGIDRSRLQPKGYGETEPLFPDAESEEHHQRNRRTAFKTLDQNFKNVFNSK